MALVEGDPEQDVLDRTLARRRDPQRPACDQSRVQATNESQSVASNALATTSPEPSVSTGCRIALGFPGRSRAPPTDKVNNRELEPYGSVNDHE